MIDKQNEWKWIILFEQLWKLKMYENKHVLVNTNQMTNCIPKVNQPMHVLREENTEDQTEIGSPQHPRWSWLTFGF